MTGWCRGGGGGRNHRNRLGWTFPWFSSHGSEFNYDFHVTFDPSITPVEYNYRDYGELVRQNPSWEGYTGSEEPGRSTGPAMSWLRRHDKY